MVSVVLDCAHHVPCCTGIHGRSRTGGHADFFNILPMEDSTWNLCSVGSDLFKGIKEALTSNLFFGGSWRSLNLMEIAAAWHLLASCFRVGTQGLDVLGEAHRLEGILHSKEGSEPQMRTTLGKFMEITGGFYFGEASGFHGVYFHSEREGF